MFPKTCPVCKHQSLEYDASTVRCGHCSVYSKKLPFFKRPFAWALTKRGWWWRLIIVGLFMVMLVQNWQNPEFAAARLGNPFSALDMGIHELGHILFTPLGDFMRIAGGSIFQCVFPLLWMIGFLQLRYYFAAALCWCWLGLNLFDVATYAADAKARLLPLATGPAGIGLEDSEANYDAGHDWYQILTRTNRLDDTPAIAGQLRDAATIVYIIGLTLALTLIVWMSIGIIRSRQDRAATSDASQ